MADDTSTHLANNLKRLREAQGLSQASLAEQSGVPRPTVAHLESGQANPTLHVVLRVARALGVSMDDLVDSGAAGIVVVAGRSLPTKKSGRVRRVQLVAPSTLRDAEVERIVVREGGRFSLEPGGALDVLICERGTFSLVASQSEATLGEEQVALVRESCEVASPLGGVVYRVSGRTA